MTPPLAETCAFEVTLHAAPAESMPVGPPLADRWGKWPTLALPPGELTEPLPVGFDDALERLGQLPRCYAEPDGSFVWTSPREGPRWQVDGNLFERNGGLLLVDLKGSCPPAELDNLLACFGGADAVCVFQLVRSAVFVSEDVFRQHALVRGQAGDGDSLRPPETCGW